MTSSRISTGDILIFFGLWYFIGFFWTILIVVTLAILYALFSSR